MIVWFYIHLQFKRSLEWRYSDRLLGRILLHPFISIFQFWKKSLFKFLYVRCGKPLGEKWWLVTRYALWHAWINFRNFQTKVHDLAPDFYISCVIVVICLIPFRLQTVASFRKWNFNGFVIRCSVLVFTNMCMWLSRFAWLRECCIVKVRVKSYCVDIRLDC